MARSWICPKCGRENSWPQNRERCPVCKTRNPTLARTSVEKMLHKARMRGFREGHGA